MAEVTLTSENFEKEVIKSEVPVLVDFWASWCGPCNMLGPIIEEVAKEMEGKGVKIGKLNVEEQSAIAQQFNIMSLPTIIFFKNGGVEKQLVGVQTKGDLLKELEKLM